MPRRDQESKTRHLTAFLLKNSNTSFEQALKDLNRLRRYGLKRDVPFEGALFLRPSRGREPSWVEFVESGLRDSIERCLNSSTSSVLFVRTGSRWIALTFGHGRYLLRPGSWEPDFGLKVTLNGVDADRLVSVDLRTWEDLTVHTRRQTSRAASLSLFGVDITRDLLRAVTGQPRDPGFARRVSGSDALVLIVPLEFHELGEKCAEMLELRNQRTYRKRFGWIDHLAAIRDPHIIAELEKKLIEDLKGGRIATAHLAAPEMLEWPNTASFSYSPDAGNRLPDLDLESYLAAIRDDLPELTIHKLHRHRVRAFDASQDLELDRWSVFDCLVYERKTGSHISVLTGGQWFRVDRSFVRRVDEVVSRLMRSPGLVLPPGSAAENEDHYNERAASTIPGCALMDRKLIRCESAASDVEACDLFTRKRQFVHVKKKTRSATLSHLFAQGTVSAEAFLREDSFREKLRELLKVQRPSLASLIPRGRPETSQYQVVYAVLARPSLELPFFSRLHLMQSAQRIQDLGFQVSLLRVPEP